MIYLSQNPSRIRQGVIALCGSALMCFTVGCTKFNLNEKIPWRDTSDAAKVPSRITALWTHTILEQPGKPGVRGFGGRLMFHDRDTEKPVRVKGTLTVFAFNDTDKHQSQPERKFVFSEQDLQQHYSHSRLGHSYSIWLPWDEVGGTPRQISLVTRFEPEKSGMVVSETAHVTLPGIDAKVKEEILAAAKEKRAKAEAKAAVADKQQSEQPAGGIQQVSHEIPNLSEPDANNVVTDSANNAGSVSSFTIDVPRRMAANALQHSSDAQHPVGGLSPQTHETLKLSANPGVEDRVEQARVPAAQRGNVTSSAEPEGEEEESKLRPGRYVRERHQARMLANQPRDRGRASLKLAPSNGPSPLTQQLLSGQNAADPASQAEPADPFR
ncbi:MAG: hypothetical protein U0903_21130 [Planctomycetales bacterium]